jgi:hypothetical protein
LGIAIFVQDGREKPRATMVLAERWRRGQREKAVFVARGKTAARDAGEVVYVRRLDSKALNICRALSRGVDGVCDAGRRTKMQGIGEDGAVHSRGGDADSRRGQLEKIVTHGQGTNFIGRQAGKRDSSDARLASCDEPEAFPPPVINVDSPLPIFVQLGDGQHRLNAMDFGRRIRGGVWLD